MIHFITGLPRSGSTLLGAILRQNPRFEGGMSTALSGLIESSLTAMSPANNEFSYTLSDTQRTNLFQALLKTWVEQFAPAETVFDTSRLWAAKLPLLEVISPESKIIACVRNPAWVFDSFECLFRKNPLQVSKIIAASHERATIYSRADALARPDRVIGFAVSALKEAYYSKQSKNMLLLEYDILASRPEEAMRLVYQFLEEEWFEHDFDNVEYSADEFDSLIGAPGLHKVARKVEFKPRQTVLPPDIFKRYEELAFWGSLSGTNCKAIVAKPSSA